MRLRDPWILAALLVLLALCVLAWWIDVQLMRSLVCVPRV